MTTIYVQPPLGYVKPRGIGALVGREMTAAELDWLRAHGHLRSVQVSHGGQSGFCWAYNEEDLKKAVRENEYRRKSALKGIASVPEGYMTTYMVEKKYGVSSGYTWQLINTGRIGSIVQEGVGSKGKRYLMLEEDVDKYFDKVKKENTRMGRVVRRYLGLEKVVVSKPIPQEVKAYEDKEEILKPRWFPKGVSGNPNGRPKHEDRKGLDWKDVAKFLVENDEKDAALKILMEKM